MSPKFARLLIVGWFLALLVVGCGYGSGAMGAGPNAPNISGLMPNPVVHGASAFTLTVGGSNFAQDSVVYFNGAPLTSAFVNATQVTAQVPASNVATAGMASVYVLSAGQTSNTVSLTIQ